MPVSYKHKAVFVHIPKTGRQSVSAMLGIGKNSAPNLYFGGLTHLNISLIEARVDVSDKYIFTFVRDPYSRMISEYHWRMKNISSVVYNEPTRKLMEFPEYMETLLHRWPKILAGEKPWNERAHVMPQYTFIDERVEVFRYENFAEDCEKIKSKLGLDNLTPRVNVGKRKAKHTERTIEIVNQLYGEDFKRFNYPIKN